MTDDKFDWCTEDNLEETDESARDAEALGSDPAPEHLPAPEERRPEMELFLKMRETDETVVFQLEERGGSDGAWLNAAKPAEIEQ